MANRFYIILVLFFAVFIGAKCQAPRSSYGMENYSYSHELNPAMHADSSYWSLPLLGNTSLSLTSSMKMGDLLFDRSDGTLTTFMNSETISKSDLMDRVGKGMNSSIDARITILSIGRRINARRYQTYSLMWHNQMDVFLDKGLFDVMKEVENRLYTIDKTTVHASSYLELAFGESRSISNHWNIGMKAKLLFGIANADMELQNMNIDLSTGKWIAQGRVNMDVSGLEYKTTAKEYKSKEETYTMVNGVKLASPGIQGIGAAIDAGANYTHDKHWSFSAAVLDLGFISWLKSHKAENNGKTFEFDGFHNISVDKESDQSFKNQWNNIADELMDMAHVEETTTGSNLRMLACTVNAGATYRYNWFSASGLVTARIYGRNTSLEGRLNFNGEVFKWLDITLSPAYSTYGFGLGSMLRCKLGHCQLYLGTDCIAMKINKQFIPTSLNTTANFGFTMPL